MKPDVWALHSRIALRSYDPGVYEEVCRELCGIGELEYADGIFKRWLNLDPGNARAQHLRAALLGRDVPERCSESFVVHEFDTFSHSFDEVLKGLEYRAPALVAAALDDERPSTGATLDVLDAGCGTGLCGPLLRRRARRLVGVDLAGGMLNKAQDRGVYDELVQSELTSFMQAHPSEFDAVVASDVLVYFGALEPVFSAFARALTPGGTLVVTVELLQTEAAAGYRLNSSGRYSHTDAYLGRMSSSFGMQTRSLATEVLRLESGTPVHGLVVRARRSEVA
ncbi:MAG: methyltransferase domain-containing protein [Burkholderiaceae bacterium]|nr:methyltransferase domain-containing protein [Burkholderiaceae bacterium]